MAKVRCLSSEELIKTDCIGKEAENPTRKLKLCTCKRYGNDFCHDYAVVVEVLGKEIALAISNSEEDALAFFNQCLDVIPCFWSPKVPSLANLAKIFDERVLTQLVELMKQHGNTWSIAHMCISLPIPENVMMILLASDSFKDHFASTVHPKRYRLLHLAVEQGSLVACKAIMRCSDQWLYTDPGLYAEDAEGETPIDRAVISQSLTCLEYLQRSQLYIHEAEAKPNVYDSKFTLGAAQASDIFMTKPQVDDTRLHDLIKRKFPDAMLAEKQRQVVALLGEGLCDPNGRIADGTTPLHLAVQGNDIYSVKALIVFGADALQVNNYGDKPLDLARKSGLQEMYDLLHLSCLSSTSPTHRGSEHNTYPSGFDGTDFQGGSRPPAYSVIDQTLMSGTFFDYRNHLQFGNSSRGDRVLCLDGGGIKGLILIDMLITIEKISGRNIRDLFDWIIGTSTGGILALAMVYTDLSLVEIRRMYFELKNDVFTKKLGDILLPDSQTEILESIIKRTVGEHTRLGFEDHPKVLITATDMSVTPMKLVFFHNINNSAHGRDQLVWAAARATSAAPFYFKQYGDYADGGLKANNPSMSGLTTIHEYYTELGLRNYKLSCVVSLGCGMFSKRMQPLDAELRKNIPNVVQLNDIPGHLRHLRLITAYKAVKQGYEGIKNLGTPVRGFLFDVLLAEISECNEEPVRYTRAFCQSRNADYFRLSPELDMQIELDEKSDEKLVDMLVTTKWYVQANIDWFYRIKDVTTVL